MLGLIHRTVLKTGPTHFRAHFKLAGPARPGESRRHNRHLENPRAEWNGREIARSVLGLVAVYNLLPEDIIRQGSVSTFQSALQRLVLDRADDGAADWAETLSPRQPLAAHPLLQAPRRGDGSGGGSGDSGGHPASCGSGGPAATGEPAAASGGGAVVPAYFGL